MVRQGSKGRGGWTRIPSLEDLIRLLMEGNSVAHFGRRERSETGGGSPARLPTSLGRASTALGLGGWCGSQFCFSLVAMVSCRAASRSFASCAPPRMVPPCVMLPRRPFVRSFGAISPFLLGVPPPGSVWQDHDRPMLGPLPVGQSVPSFGFPSSAWTRVFRSC
ncbi:hypothetical protein R1flu_019177 [Riccia fluitans]|uniref:Uncharacterized protein n=1 Tax=Riccia fluitans TaxID=41844 RepID=A0ABD1ZLS8_9MARC